jgi:hypothetical protein
MYYSFEDLCLCVNKPTERIIVKGRGPESENLKAL